MGGGARGLSWYYIFLFLQSNRISTTTLLLEYGGVLIRCMQPGGQDSQLVAPDLSTHLDATYLLQTHDHPPAFISVKTEGWRVGPREILEKLEDPAVADEVDPKSYCFRLFVHMETGDTRYLHLNTGMWVGSGVRRGTEGMSCSMLFFCLVVALGGKRC